MRMIAIIWNIPITVLILNKMINIVLLKMMYGPLYFLITEMAPPLPSEFETPGSEFHKFFVTNSLHSPLREHH
jgi:hypothetical protein